ncbi:MAG: hypothetical protein HKN29_13905 [Rhodothermales bacterium]|nr:hypothetical protein [Rhodothermales bacterium]
MEMPTNRRDQLVMGLSICALILLVANIATFVKQRFLDTDSTIHHTYVVSGTSSDAVTLFGGQGHEWHVKHRHDNEVWSVGEDIDRKRRHRARYKWRLHADHVDQVHADEVDALIEEARRAARAIEMDLGLQEMPRLHLDSIDGAVEIEESQDETGRHTYRIVVKPDSDSR